MPTDSISLGDLVAGAGFYNAEMASLAGTYTALSWVPRDGNYSGNQQNDAWLKAQALELSYPAQFDHGIDFTDPRNRTVANAIIVNNMINGAQANEIPGLDPIGIAFADPLDAAALQHDLAHGAASQANDVWGEVAANETYAAAALSSFVSTGNWYALGAAAFIGLASTANDIVQAAIGWGASVISSFTGFITGLFSSDGQSSYIPAYSSDAASVGYDFDSNGSYDSGSWADTSGSYADDYYYGYGYGS